MDTETPERYIEDYDVIGVEVLRTGTFTGMGGKKVEATVKMFDTIIANYDVDHLEGRISIDHQWGGPAWMGRIKKIYRKGEKLLVDLRNVPRWIALGMLRDGDWPYRSVEVWKDLDGMGAYLDMVSLLGIATPAVRALAWVTEDNLQPNYRELPEANDSADVGEFSFAFSETRDGVIRFGIEAPAAGDETQPQEQTLNMEVQVMPDKASAEPNDEKVDLAAQEARDKLATAMERIADLEAENTEKDTKLAEAVTGKAAAELKAESVEKETAARLEALEADKVRFTHERIHEKNEVFVSKLMTDKGGIVAPLANFPLANFLTALDTNAEKVKMTDGKEADLGEVARDLLNALPVFRGGLELAPNADEVDEKHGLSAVVLQAIREAGSTPEAYMQAMEDNKERGVAS